MALLLRIVRKLGYPRQLFYEFLFFPKYVVNIVRYLRTNNNPSFPMSIPDLYYATSDSKQPAGHVDSHYFLQDIWAARQVNAVKVDIHVDIGSRIDGFISHLLASNQKVTYLDWRAPEIKDPCFKFAQANVMSLPFPDNSVKSLSCLHVLEHIGLGRYGDPVDSLGHVKATKELARVLSPGGVLLISVPIGKEKLCFDAHRVFDPKTILNLFKDLGLIAYSYIDPAKNDVFPSNPMEDFSEKKYFCGLFAFRKA